MMSRLTPFETSLAVVRRRTVDKVTQNFRNESKMWVPPGARGVFGGVLIGQAINAAMESVPEQERANFRPHSFHGYFVRAGVAELPVDYRVTSLRDGRNYLSREVKALQSGDVAFSALVSLTRKSDGPIKYNKFAYQRPMPEHIKGPEECLAIKDAFSHMSTTFGEETSRGRIQQMAESYLASGVEWRFPQEMFDGTIRGSSVNDNPVTRSVYLWIRVTEPLADLKNTYSVLGWFSDSFFLLGFQKLLGHVPFTAEFTVSLDHGLYIHSDEVEVSDWLCFHITSTRYQDKRALMHGEVFTADGKCVASVVQEGMVMPNMSYASALSKL